MCARTRLNIRSQASRCDSDLKLAFELFGLSSVNGGLELEENNVLNRHAGGLMVCWDCLQRAKMCPKSGATVNKPANT
jgi:hypothetical protein